MRRNTRRNIIPLLIVAARSRSTRCEADSLNPLVKSRDQTSEVHRR
jgi:hypothetical protein